MAEKMQFRDKTKVNLLSSLLLTLLLTCGFLYGKAAWNSTKGLLLRHEQQPAEFAALQPLYAPKLFPGEGDWSYEHAEAGQSFRDFSEAFKPNTAKPSRPIYIQLFGGFSPEEEELANLAARFLGIYLCAEVKVLPPITEPQLTESATRWVEDTDEPQISTRYILQKVMKPRLPENALAFLMLTSSDLWPGNDWGYLFGQAAPEFRSAVYSLFRMGNSSGFHREKMETLQRLLKVSTHEVAHILGFRHCPAYDCNMNGSNSLDELDRNSLHLCPICLRKLIWLQGCDPVARFSALAGFYREHGLREQESFMLKSLDVFEAARSKP